MRRGIAPITAAALLVLLMALALESLANTVATPLLYGLWILRLALASIPQGAFWAVLLLAGFLLALRILLRRGGRRENVQASHGLRPEGVRVWADFLAKSRERGYFRWRLAKGLNPLILEALAARENQQVHQVERRVEEGEVDLPQHFRDYLDAGASTKSYRQYLESRLDRGRSSPVDIDPARVVRYLEDALDLSWSSGPPRRADGKTSPLPRSRFVSG